MRIVPVTILGKEYDLCFSTRVMMRMEEKNLDTETTIGNVHLLSYMMEAGDTYAKMCGHPGKGFLTVDEIADNLSPAEVGALGLTMSLAVNGDRNVETTDTAKNAPETPSDA